MLDRNSKELLVSRICSGSVRVRVSGRDGDRTFIIKRPSREDVYIANEIYFDSLRDSELEGLYSEDELLDFMIDNGFWTEEDEKFFEDLPKEIDEFKVKLFKAAFKQNERQTIRKALQLAKNKFAQIAEKRSAYSHLSCVGAASLSKSRYILGASLYTLSGKKVFDGWDDFWDSESKFLDDIIAEYSRLRITETEFRELARTDPWRQLWNSAKVEGRLFGIPPADYTDDQATLVSWSGLYENIYQHPDAPGDEVIGDDDLLDGWMIEQNRNRTQNMNKKRGEDLIKNERIKNAQEVYIVAETIEDARKVVDMNDEFSKSIQKSRFKILKEKGQVNELEMPDTKNRLRMEATRKLHGH